MSTLSVALAQRQQQKSQWRICTSPPGAKNHKQMQAKLLLAVQWYL